MHLVYITEQLTVFLLLLTASHVSTAQLVTQQVKGIVGESLTFPVEIPNLQPDTELNWRYSVRDLDLHIARIQNGKIEVFEERFKARLQLDNMSSSLRINGLEREDSGFYQVEIFKGNSFKKRFHLAVYSQPRTAAQLGGQQMKGIVGESFTFPVKIANLTTEIEVNWRYGPASPDRLIARLVDGKIKTDYNERFKSRLQLNMNTGSLQIHHLNTEDSGIYHVETVRDIFHKRFDLSVYNPVPEPQVLQIHSGEALANRSCTLLCFVGNASEVNVFWMRDGKPLNTTELEISQEMQGGDVTYTCVASNPVSNKTTTVTPSHYCGKRNSNREGETTTIRPSTELIVRVLVFIVLSGVVIAVCVSVWKKINASSECRVVVNRLQLSQQTDDKLTTVYEEVQAES